MATGRRAEEIGPKRLDSIASWSSSIHYIGFHSKGLQTDESPSHVAALIPEKDIRPSPKYRPKWTRSPLPVFRPTVELIAQLVPVAPLL